MKRGGTRIVGLCGYARSGKDTAAKALTESGEWRRAAFADALKADVLHAMIGSAKAGGIPRAQWPRWSWFEDAAAKERLRPLLVEYGRAMRGVSPDYWIRRLERDYMRGGQAVAVTDVRYANEAEWIRSLGGLVIEIARPGTGPANAEEERSMQCFEADYTVCNAGDIGSLHAQVSRLVKGWYDK